MTRMQALRLGAAIGMTCAVLIGALAQYHGVLLPVLVLWIAAWAVDVAVITPRLDRRRRAREQAADDLLDQLIANLRGPQA